MVPRPLIADKFMSSQAQPPTTDRTAGKPAWQTPLLVLIAGCLIAAIGFGVRSTLGLFLEPMTVDRGWSRQEYAMALAIQNLFWGLGLPLAGAFADKFGATRVISLGAIVYAIGLYGMSLVEGTGPLYLFAGVLAGTGIAFSAFSIALAAMVRVVGVEKRTIVLGLGTAAGSFGQVVFSPFAQGLIEGFGWSSALTILAILLIGMIPLALLLPKVQTPAGQSAVDQSLRDALFF